MAQQKNAAEKFIEAEDLHKKGILSDLEFEKVKQDCLKEKVDKDADKMAELQKWAEIAARGGITDEQLKDRKNKLVYGEQDDQKNVKPKPKKKSKATYWALLAGGILVTLVCLNSLRSCLSNRTYEAPRHQEPKTTIKAPQISTESPTKAAALAGTESWRAGFKAKTKGFDEKDVAALEAGMTSISYARECYIAHSKGDQRGLKFFAQKRKDVLAKLKKSNPKIYRIVKNENNKLAAKQKRAGGHYEINMEEVGNRILNAYSKDQAAKARVNKAKSADR